MQQELIIELVQQVRKSNKKMGGKKLYHLLEADIHRIDASMGRDKFFVYYGSGDYWCNVVVSMQ